jgi:plastocyanin
MATASISAKPSRFARQPLSALSKVTIAGLVAFFATIMYGMLGIFGEIVPPFLIMAVAGLLIGALVSTGWRWTPILAALIALLPAAMLLPMFQGVLTQYSVAGLTMFSWAAVFVAVIAVTVVAALSALVQNYVRPAGQRRTPRILAPALAAVVALVVGATLVVAAPQPGTVIDISQEAMAALPAMGAKNFEFTQTELRVKVGETVTMRLDNADFEGHFFEVDELNIHAPMPPEKSSLVVFTPTQPGEYTFYCHPHIGEDPATGEKVGMVGKLIVE